MGIRDYKGTKRGARRTTVGGGTEVTIPHYQTTEGLGTETLPERPET